MCLNTSVLSASGINSYFFKKNLLLLFVEHLLSHQHLVEILLLLSFRVEN